MTGEDQIVRGGPRGAEEERWPVRMGRPNPSCLPTSDISIDSSRSGSGMVRHDMGGVR